ncbi:MAG: hypothetical protein A3I66_04880 [Burkholderiales bacterium RIFCSPLOWO2_02_FULL_57_36]|nr:MAG: hypothetical protein A3I66_04880 [Burkholderiales bacterium RIFCSPLOWO2_02_FULL_57_36]
MKIPGAIRRQLAGALVLFTVSLPTYAADKTKPAQTAVKGDTILVTVNGQPVRRALFDGMVKARTEIANPYDAPDEGAANKPKGAPVIDQKVVFEDLLSMEILSQKARERGIHLRPEIAAEAELQYKTLLQQELVRDIIAEIRIEPAEIKVRYDALKPERSYHVSHILLNSEQEAKAVIRELDKGAKFQAAARKHTLDANTKKDGMLGWMMASQLEPSFVAGIETLKPDGYSRIPVQTQYGWHIIQLHGARFLDKPPFAQAQTWLRQEILHEKVTARVQQIRHAAKVEVPAPQ